MEIDTKPNLRFIALPILAYLLLTGCASIFPSSLTQDEIRATAYHLATTQLATTYEVAAVQSPTPAHATRTPTLDPLLCPQAELTTWYAFLLEDFLILSGELQLLESNEYDTAQLDMIIDRANSKILSVAENPHPECADESTRLLSEVYEEYSVSLESVRSESSSSDPSDWENFLNVMKELFMELRKLYSGADFHELRIAFEEF